jgi:hypothetical protein
MAMKSPRVMSLQKTRHFKDRAASPNESDIRELARDTSLRTCRSTNGIPRKNRSMMRVAVNLKLGTCSCGALFHVRSVW